MSYMWNEFNIKTFPAETIVYRDGVFCPDLSTLENIPVNSRFNLPVHIIYVGEIDGENKLDVSVGAENQEVIISVNVKIKKSAFLNIFIKNAGENSKIHGIVLLENNGGLDFCVRAEHLKKNTAILIKNKVFARKNSNTKMYADAKINQECDGCVSDVSLDAMAEKGAVIEFMPSQHIHSEPQSAEHSTSIYKPTNAQVFYLRGAGLAKNEVDAAMKEAFLSFD